MRWERIWERNKEICCSQTPHFSLTSTYHASSSSVPSRLEPTLPAPFSSFSALATQAEGQSASVKKYYQRYKPKLSLMSPEIHREPLLKSSGNNLVEFQKCSNSESCKKYVPKCHYLFQPPSCTNLSLQTNFIFDFLPRDQWRPFLTNKKRKLSALE